MDLETELRRVLRDRDVPLPVTDPVPAVHSGIRRRRRTQRLQVAASAAAVAVLAVGATAVVQHRGGQGTKPQPTAVHPIPDPIAVPRGFEALDVSYTDTSTVWALGTIKCSTGYCPLLLTSSRGAPWRRSTAPSAAVPAPDGTSTGDCAVMTCVSHIRFARGQDGAQVGYAYGPGLLVTHDDGRTWQDEHVAGEVLALEPSGSSVIRVRTPVGGLPGTQVAVERTALGAESWQPVAGANDPVAALGLVRLGRRFVVLQRGNPAGGVVDARSHLLFSKDDGLTWTPREDPCGPLSARSEVDTTQVALAPNGVVAVLCDDRFTPGRSFVRVSEDSGRTYHAARVLPSHGLLLATAGNAILVSVDDDLLRHRLLRSTDAGRTWTQVASQQSPVSRGSEYLAFTTERSGTWIGGDRRRLVRTDDGGATWKDQPLHR